MNTPNHRATGLPEGRTKPVGDVSTAMQRFLVVKEAASILGVSSMTLYRLIREGQFPALRLRSRWIVPVEVVAELVGAPSPVASVLRNGLVDVPIAARVLRVSAATLYRLIHDGGFPAVWLRGRVLVPGGVVEEMATAAMSVRSAVDPQDWVGGPGGARCDGAQLLGTTGVPS